jgi:acyl transferase domain-containing protein/acyl carrier protein
MNNRTGNNRNHQPTGLEIAVIGMAGRFPGASNVEQFWTNLKHGVESVSFYSDQELSEAGVPPGLLEDPHFVKSGGAMLEDKEYFDASFFGYTPREAEIMDPQMRIFHECAWEALEHAGYNPVTFNAPIGLYAGGSSTFYWEAMALLSGKSDAFGSFGASQLTNVMFLSTRISYNFNLKGPAVFVQSACSTSLVAIHMACRALLTGECKIALAGGVTVGHLEQYGYLFEEGMISSPDGHCRSFDAASRGATGGKGAGAVVLKPLKLALADRDYIHAVIKGSASNNDGDRKVGYSAPSIKGQTEVIRAAQRFARVEPESITYIETHGTGTPLGDPVEVAALTKAFDTGKKAYCAIGSVKTNVGHMDSAAGVAGFIKAVLALKYRLIPPSLNFNTPNPQIDFENSPFYVNNHLKEWSNGDSGNGPLRAGVSSFGIGGTNVHVILEGAPAPAASKEHTPSRDYRLILLSARTAAALDQGARNLVDHLANRPGLHLPDVAFTLQVGRQPLNHRKMMVCTSLEETVDALSSPDSAAVHYHRLNDQTASRGLVFMFSGQGSQYTGMGLELYQKEPLFKEELDRCFDLLETIMGHDIKQVLYPNRDSESLAAGKDKPGNMVDDVLYSGPVKFSFDYALAKLIMSWGVLPDAMIGHSFGEYVVACLAGVFSLEDALKLVVLRGRVMEKTAPGAMMSVPLPEKELLPLLKENDLISLAAVNTDSLCIVSGPSDAVDNLEHQLSAGGHECLRINFPRASHSSLMEPILSEFESAVARVKLNEPRISYISGITGTWMTNQMALDPSYWARHLRQTVRFREGITCLMEELNPLFVQVGSDKGLPLFVSLHPGVSPDNLTVNLVRHPKDPMPDLRYLLSQIGRLWLWGIQPGWEAFYADEKRCRLPLPTYPFERQRYWIDGDLSGKAASMFSRDAVPQRKADIADWFYAPSWTRSLLVGAGDFAPSGRQAWLIFIDHHGIGLRIAEQLERDGHDVVTVKAGPAFEVESEEPASYTVNPARKEDYEKLIIDLEGKEKKVPHILHLWSICTCHDNVPLPERLETAFEHGAYSLVYLAQALANRGVTRQLQITIMSDGMQDIYGNDLRNPEKATLLGPVKVIPLEYSNINCRSIDIQLTDIAPGSPAEDTLISQLYTEIHSQSPDPVVGYRGGQRWVWTYQSLRLENGDAQTLALKQGGVYMITGGLGGIGMEMARYLSRSVNAKLALIGRTDVPPPEEWDQWLDDHGDEDNISRKIKDLKNLRDLGSELLVTSADVSDLEQMKTAVKQIEQTFGAVHGIIHAAGVPGGGVIQLKSIDAFKRDTAAKIQGTLVLHELFHREPLDFLVLCSSINAIMPAFGQVDYCAANAFLDAFSNSTTGGGEKGTVSVNWGGWKNIGMSVAVEQKHKEIAGDEMSGGMTGGEGIEAFGRILVTPLPQVVASPMDLLIMLKQYYMPEPTEIGEGAAADEIRKTTGTLFKRPELSTQYTGPQTESQQKMAQIWQDFFGYQQVGIEDDFFELGGDSLKATILTAKIHRSLNVKIPLTEIFKSPTIKKLDLYLRSAAENKYASIAPVEKKEYYPQSSAQKRLFFLDRASELGTAYNVLNVFEMKGVLDRDRFRRAMDTLIARHETLRSSFDVIGHEPVQIVHEPGQVDFEIPFVCLENPDDPEHIDEAITHFRLSFDLANAPLLRVGIIQLSGERHLLLYDIHHIICDGSSSEILIGEFIRLYGGETLPSIDVQYKDFACWQTRFFQSGQMQLQEKYWLEQFAGGIPRLNFITDYPRKEIPTFAGDEYNFKLDKSQSSLLKEQCARHNVTLFINLLAAFNVLLHKYTSREDIVIGSSIMGRPHPDLEKIVGMFVNKLAILNRPSPEKSYSQFLNEVKKTSLKAFENQDMQFEELVTKLKLERTLSQNPLFDVSFAFQNFEKSNETISDVSVKPYSLAHITSKFDFSIQAHEDQREIFFMLEYSTELFKPETIQTLAQRYIEIMRQVSLDDDIKIGDIKISHTFQALETQSVDYDFEF